MVTQVWSGFNPRPREAGDLTICGDASLEVSIHARVKRATRSGAAVIEAWSFNPRPREAGDLLRWWPFCRIEVSIHARVKRATSAFPADPTAANGFNPRPREAGDPCWPLALAC